MPVEVVTPILLKLIAERDYQDGERRRGGKRLLADETGMDEKRWRDMFTGRQKYVSFGVVDTVLTKTGNWHLWYEMPLARYYDETHTTKLKMGPAKKKRPAKKKLRLCERCQEPLKKHGTRHCMPCYKAIRQERRPRCECGALIERRSTQCLECFKVSRGKAGKRQRKWVSGEAWQLT